MWGRVARLILGEDGQTNIWKFGDWIVITLNTWSTGKKRNKKNKIENEIEEEYNDEWDNSSLLTIHQEI